MRRKDGRRMADEVHIVPAEVLAGNGYVVLVLPFRPIEDKMPDTVGLRFTSPEHMLAVFTEIIEKAAEVWPDNKWIKEYRSYP